MPMPIELRVPEVGESIREVEIGDWLKSPGEQVKKDDPVVTLESENATVELPAPESGIISKVLKQKGQTAKVGEVIGLLEKDGHATPSESQEKSRPAKEAPKEKAPPQPEPTKAEITTKEPPDKTPETSISGRPSPAAPALMPSVQRLLDQHK